MQLYIAICYEWLLECLALRMNFDVGASGQSMDIPQQGVFNHRLSS